MNKQRVGTDLSTDLLKKPSDSTVSFAGTIGGHSAAGYALARAAACGAIGQLGLGPGTSGASRCHHPF